MTPKTQFQANKEQREAFAKMVASPVFETAITYALAEMANKNMADRIIGANSFVSILKNLSEDDAASIPAYPDKALKTY